LALLWKTATENSPHTGPQLRSSEIHTSLFVRKPSHLKIKLNSIYIQNTQVLICYVRNNEKMHTQFTMACTFSKTTLADSGILESWKRQCVRTSC